MAVKIRERKPGEWWIYVDHNNKRKAKKIGTKDAAQKVAKQIEARLTLGDLGILKPEQAEKPEPRFADYQKTWLEQTPAHANLMTRGSRVLPNRRASAARCAAGRPAKRTNGFALAAMNGIRSTREDLPSLPAPAG
jgi:hypothetical protein